MVADVELSLFASMAFFMHTATKVVLLVFDFWAGLVMRVMAMYKLVQHNMCTMTPVKSISHRVERTVRGKNCIKVILIYRDKFT